MIGYSEVLQVIGAMVIFSLILLSATSMIQRNTYMQVEGAMEREVVAVAQDIIEEGRTQDFDEVTSEDGEYNALPPPDIPGDFTGSASLGCESTDDENGDGNIERHEFNDFDDYNCINDEIVNTEHGEFNISAEVFYVTSDHDSTGTRTAFKKMRIFVTSKFLTGGSGDKVLYNFEFIRNYYAD